MPMFHRTLFWSMWLGILLPTGISAEGKSPKEVIGILGESATFLLESPSPFDVVLWFKNEVQNEVQVATLRLGPPCQLELLAAYQNRDVTVSRDCRSLTVRGLREEDAAGYRAQMLNNLKTLASQTFTLKVYKRLSESDVKVSCAKETLRDGNKTWHVNCSVGKWEDGVDFSWTAHSRSGQISSSEKSLVFFDNPQDKDWNATCVAKNPVGNASRTFSPQQECAAAGKQPTGRPPTAADPETGDAPPSGPQTMAIVVSLVLVAVVVAVAAGLWYRRSKKTVAERNLNTSSSNSGPKECKSLYAEIQIVPEDGERERPQQRKSPEARKEVPKTIYADVQHPEKSPLQTDDEKMRREKRRAAVKSEKTIYSEISDLKEPPEEKLKTIYDTVNHSRPPEASEYHKIL